MEKAFKFKGLNSVSKGIKLSRPLIVSPAIPNVTAVKIPGRNGDLHYWDGSYQNRTITAECFALDSNIFEKINSINSWLLSEFGYHEFQDIADTSHFMLARATQGVSHEIRQNMLNPFVLEFDARPERFLVSGKNQINAMISTSVTNPTSYDAFPLLEIEADTREQPLTFRIGSKFVSFTGIFGTWTYDAETEFLNIINEAAPTQNLNVTSNGKFSIKPGTNQMSYDVPSAVYKLKVIPRWWEI